MSASKSAVDDRQMRKGFAGFPHLDISVIGYYLSVLFEKIIHLYTWDVSICIHAIPYGKKMHIHPIRPCYDCNVKLFGRGFGYFLPEG